MKPLAWRTARIIAINLWTVHCIVYRKSGLWYAHMRGYQHVPVSGSFSEKRRDAAEYAKMYNGLPHKVEEIERKRREAFEKEMEKA